MGIRDESVVKSESSEDKKRSMSPIENMASHAL